MKIEILANPENASAALAERLQRLIASRPDVVLGLATGRTMIPVYRAFAAKSEHRSIDLTRIRAFNVDELLLPRNHPASFRRYMLEHAVPALDLRPERWSIPRSDPPDPHAEARRYGQELEAAGGLEAVLLGLGRDGHVAYNLPGERPRNVHVVELPGGLADDLGIEAALRPVRAITLGLEELLRARTVLLLATTPEKQEAVARLVHGGDPVRWPCAALRDHPGLEVFLTPESAAGLGSTSKRSA